MNKYEIYFWEFIRGDLSTDSFEKYIYDDKELENVLESNLYLQVLENNFKNKNSTENLKSVLKDYMLKENPLKCWCISVGNLDRMGFGASFTDDVFESLVETKKRGEKYWWLSLYQCKCCNQFWFIAQDEGLDEFYLLRLNEMQAKNILENEVWPDQFDDYDSLSKIEKFRTDKYED